MELQAILDEIGKNPSLIDGLMQPIFDSEKGKAAIANRVNTEVAIQIAEKIKETHTRYDEDMNSILGERPGQKEGGAKEKTYEKVKALFEELKGLRGQKESLTKDAEVARLTAEIESLKKTGGGEIIKQAFDEAKAQWTAKEAEYLKKIEDSGKQGTEFQIKSALATAKAGLNFNPDMDEEIRNIVLEKAESTLLSGAKVEGDKITFFKPDGKPYLNPTTYEPMTASEVLSSLEGVQKIVKKDGQQGGGADPAMKGGITTVKVEGKDDKKKLDLQGTFKTQMEFTEAADKLLRESGVTKSDPTYFQLKDEAYKEHNVASLPLQ
jgi:hypothetical protein